ncbi:MAG: sensor histidine kinase [Elusimicrobiales bacterium]
MKKINKCNRNQPQSRAEQAKNRNMRLAGELKERTKELRCMYAISEICESSGVPLEDMLQGIVELLPASLQYPELACARLVSHAGVFRTANFLPTRYRQKAPLIVNGRRAGTLEVCYLRKSQRGAGALFLKAELKLLYTIAERLGKIIELKDAERELKAAHEKLHSLLRSVENSREEERKRIAHELHDELGHALMAIKIDLRGLRDSLPDAEAIIAKTRNMDSVIDTTIRNIRRIAWELRPILLDEFGLQAAISALGKDFEGRYGIRCSVRICSRAGQLEKSVALTLYRVVQELLTNVARHAMATKVSLALNSTGPGLALIFRDNGKGIPESAMSGKKTLGLLGIRERVYGCGGTLRIQGRRNRGTCVSISIPLRAAKEAK